MAGDSWAEAVWIGWLSTIVSDGIREASELARTGPDEQPRMVSRITRSFIGENLPKGLGVQRPLNDDDAIVGAAEFISKPNCLAQNSPFRRPHGHGSLCQVRSPLTTFPRGTKAETPETAKGAEWWTLLGRPDPRQDGLRTRGSLVNAPGWAGRWKRRAQPRVPAADELPGRSPLQIVEDPADDRV